MINNSVPKYTVRVGGSDRTIDSEKFNTHLDAIIEQTPDARIRVVNKETGESRAMPVGNYRQAVASGIYSPYETNTFKNTPRASVAPAAIARASANENDVNAGAQVTLRPVPQPTIPKSSITSWLPPAQDNYVELRPEQLPDAEMRAADAVAATRRAKEHRQKGLENWLADQRPHSVAEVYADLQRERQTIGGQIKEMTATLAGKKKEAGAQWMAKEEEARKENPFATALLYAGRAPRTAEIADYDTSNYNIAQSFADDARKIYEQWERNQRSDANYIKNAGYGFKDGVFDVDTWTFGITDLLKNISLGQVVEKADRGEALSDSEQSLLDAVALQLATAAFYGSDLGRGYKAGQVGAVALPFMAEMALNPLAGAGKGLANSVAKYGLKRFGEKALQSVGGRIVKGGARVIGDIGASYGGALTVGMGSTLADASNRMTGDIQFDFSDGRPVYAGRGNAEDFWPAFAKAATARAGEYYSERLGDYIGPLFGKLGNVLGKTKPGAGFARWPGVRQAKELIGGISNTEFRKLLQAGGLHNIPTELLEEEFNLLLNWGTVGDVSWSDITDLDQQIDLGLGVATLGGALSAMNMSGYRFNGQYSAQRSMERADRRA